MLEYIPKNYISLSNLKYANVPSAWVGLESIIEDILKRFEIGRNLAIDFGVDHGFSTAIFSNYFTRVIGVDNFKGDDQRANRYHQLYELAQKNLVDFKNITLIQKDYKDFIEEFNDLRADLIHVDIIHNFEDTFKCGLWAATHSDITLFHDTESFPETVRPAVELIAKQINKTLYNFPKYNGLGIVC